MTPWLRLDRTRELPPSRSVDMSNMSVSLINVKRLERVTHVEYRRRVADEQKTERVQLLMTPSEVKAVDDWSFENRVRGRSEAIRRLIELGLKATQSEAK